MSGLKTRFCVCAAVLLSLAATRAVRAVELPGAGVPASTASINVMGDRAVVAMATPWSWKWFKHKLPHQS